MSKTVGMHKCLAICCGEDSCKNYIQEFWKSLLCNPLNLLTYSRIKNFCSAKICIILVVGFCAHFSLSLGSHLFGLSCQLVLVIFPTDVLKLDFRGRGAGSLDRAAVACYNGRSRGCAYNLVLTSPHPRRHRLNRPAAFCQGRRKAARNRPDKRPPESRNPALRGAAGCCSR